MLRQHKFLTKLLERLSTTEQQIKVLEEIESVRKTLTSAENFSIYIASNVDRLSANVQNIYAPWEKNFSEFKSNTVKSK